MRTNIQILIGNPKREASERRRGKWFRGMDQQQQKNP
jgi:hypothetical protein